jgi:hypothetical protein
MHDRLKFQKVSARWVPKELKDQEKMKNRMGLSLQHLLRYAYEAEDMFNRIVIGEKSWVTTTNLNASMLWKHPSSPSTIKFKVMLLAGKVMFTVFWDSQGVVLAHFQ